MASRDEILANFQAMSSVEDISECISILDSVDWDLMRAVHAVTPGAGDNPEVVHVNNGEAGVAEMEEMVEDNPFAALQNSSYAGVSFSPARQLNFTISYNAEETEHTVFDYETVEALKRSVNLRTAVPTGNIRLTGWRVNVDDNTVLSSLHLPLNTRLSMSNVDPAVAEGDLPPGHLHDIVNDDEAAPMDGPAEPLVTVPPRKKLTNDLPLIPGEMDSIEDSLENFVRIFQSRYGEFHAMFSTNNLSDIATTMSSVPAKDRRPFLLYLHDDASISANVFCSHVLCNEELVKYINANFTLWPWDFSVDENKDKFLELCRAVLGTTAAQTIRSTPSSHHPVIVVVHYSFRFLELCRAVLGTTAAQTIRIIPSSHHPVIVVVHYTRGTFKVESVIPGSSNSAEVIHALLAADDDIKLTLQDEIADEEQRMQRTQMRDELKEAYLQSLQQDQEKEAAKQIAESVKQGEEALERAQAEEHEAKKDRLAHRVPEEPPADCGEPMVTFKIRLPDGSTVERRFLASGKFANLIAFVGSKGYFTSEYRITTSFPKRDITELDPAITFAEQKLATREALLVELR